jgi:hypothetical protein
MIQGGFGQTVWIIEGKRDGCFRDARPFRDIVNRYFGHGDP